MYVKDLYGGWGALRRWNEPEAHVDSHKTRGSSWRRARRKQSRNSSVRTLHFWEPKLSHAEKNSLHLSFKALLFRRKRKSHASLRETLVRGVCTPYYLLHTRESRRKENKWKGGVILMRWSSLSFSSPQVSVGEIYACPSFFSSSSSFPPCQRMLFLYRRKPKYRKAK